jgi:hypothetical protein
MKKKKRVNKDLRREKFIYRSFAILTVFLIVGIIYSRAMLSKINLEVQDLNNKISMETDDNQSLAMKINEMVSLEKIQQVSTELGLKYDNDNIRSVLE